MDMSGSGWSSGCESGWTGYLDESFVPRNEYSGNYVSYDRLNYCKVEDEVEEDLSMVSDASSGPRHFQGDGSQESYGTTRGPNGYIASVKASRKSEKRSKKSVAKEMKLSKHQNEQHSFSSNNHLDDTASSTALTYSKMYENHSSYNQASTDQYINFPQGISENYYQESSSYNNNNNNYGFWQSSLPKDATSAQPSHFGGNRWE
ncbi:hypothetical protein vseg_001544 [Gypsophila vaccaria]